MEVGDRLQRLLGLRERDEEASLPGPDTGQEKLQGERCLSGAGPALDQVHVVAPETITQYLVQAQNARGSWQG
jgi:hypothetical protein